MRLKQQYWINNQKSIFLRTQAPPFPKERNKNRKPMANYDGQQENVSQTLNPETIGPKRKK
jgi:hypothetical protein